MKKICIILILFSLSAPGWSQKKFTPPRNQSDRLNETYCTGLFSLDKATYFDMVNDKSNQTASSYLNILDWLHGRVAGLDIKRISRNIKIPFIRNQKAGVYVNEVWVDYDYLNTLPVVDIAMIKIIKGPFLGRWGGDGGAILIYTKDGDDSK